MRELKLNVIDARGRSCPEPVLLTKKALEQSPGGLQVLVDNTTARNNVVRFAENRGYKVGVVEAEDTFTLTIAR